MKNVFVILFVFLSKMAFTQSIFEFDKFRVMSYNPNTIGVEINDIDSKGQIIFNKDTTLVDIVFKGLSETIKIRKQYSTFGNKHLRADFYEINQTEQLVLFFHDDRLYTVAINNKKESFCNIKYVKTKW